MLIAILGGYGQLGTALGECLGENAKLLSHSECDLLDFDCAIETLDHFRPTTIINCAAYNFVDRAETQLDAAHALNVVAPGRLAEYCAARDILLVQISSDYVFGKENLPRKKPFSESDLPLPDSIYGATKLLGERRVAEKWRKHFLIRTCGLYGKRKSAGKGNFIETMLRLGSERNHLNVVDDQVCTPTFTRDLAQAIVDLLETDQYGLYHATNSGETTWCQLAREIFRLKKMNVTVDPITSEEFGADAWRPPYSVLDCSKLESVIGRKRPSWQNAVKRYLDERTDSAR